MPTWMRIFHIQKINEYNKKQEKEYDKIKGSGESSSNKISTPNINPSSFYNIKK